jgi:putative aldouronate transport system substrate-binding protein
MQKRKNMQVFIAIILVIVMLSACNPTQTTTGSTGATTTGTGTTTATTTATTADPNAWQSDPNLNEPGIEPICKETVKLTVGLRENANVSDFETNDMTKLLEERSNIDLSFQYYTSEMATQINLIVAGGDFSNLPDIMLLSPGDAYIYQWGQAGAILPLNEYYENSAYHLKEALVRTGVDFMPMITSPDGNIYGLPTYNQSIVNEYNGKLWVYQPWLDQLDLDVPVTTDDFFNVASAFLTQDPNGNGKADEIPALGVPYSLNVNWMQALVNPFQFMGTNQYFRDGDKVDTWFTTDGYREALKFINKLFANGLMPDYQFTIDTTAYNNLVGNAEIPLVGFMFGTATSASGRVPDYLGVGPLKQPGASSTDTAFSASVANVSGMISSASEFPETAFRLGDLMCSEFFSIMTRFGIEGVNWDYTKNATLDMTNYKPVFGDMYPAYIVFYEDPWGIVQNFHWYQAGPFIRQYGIAGGRLVPKGQVNSESMIADVMPSYQAVGEASSMEKAVGKLIYKSNELSAITEINNSIQTYVMESTAAFALGNQDINNDAVWNSYLAQLDSIGLQDVLQIVQNVYDRMYK